MVGEAFTSLGLMVSGHTAANLSDRLKGLLVSLQGVLEYRYEHGSVRGTPGQARTIR